MTDLDKERSILGPHKEVQGYPTPAFFVKNVKRKGMREKEGGSGELLVASGGNRQDRKEWREERSKDG